MINALSFLYLMFLYATNAACMLIRQTDTDVQQTCRGTLQLQRVDAFAGDDVQLACTCQNQLQSQQQTKRKSVVTDSSDFLDISAWAFAGELQDPIEMYDFSFVINKKWAELISDDEDAVKTDSGNSDLANCVFPFLYNNKQGREVELYTCSESGRSDSTCWCSTTANYTKDKRWGFCPCASPKRGIRLMAEYGTDPGKYCHFPFKYSGNEYYGCIYEGRERCWCGTTYDVNRDKKWGYCPCATSSLKGHWSAWGKWKSCKCGRLTYRTRTCRSKFKNLPTGRVAVCDGFALEAALCSCVSELHNQLVNKLADIKRRSSVTAPDRISPYAQIIISNLTVTDSGWYYCKRGKLAKLNGVVENRVRPIVAYEINVINLEETQVILEDDGHVIPYNTGQHGEDRLVWFWTDWQVCDRCGILTGEQKRFGFCYTQEPAGNGIAVHLSPCRSLMMPEMKRYRMQIFQDYLVVKTCKVKCHKTREKYKLVKIDRSFPTRRPPAVRAIYRARKGDNIHLKCPGAHPLLPVTWQFEEKTLHADLDPLLRHREKSKRSRHKGKIGVNDELSIQKITEFSAGYFSCFVNRTLSASYSIVVEEHFVQSLRGFLDDMIYVVIGFVLFLFLSIAYNVIKLEHKAVVAY